jgi:putative transposase
MKSRYKIFKNDDLPYFLTMNVFLNIPVFTNSFYMDVIIDNFQHYRDYQDLKIFSYVIMDNHIHLIASHNKDLSGIIQSFKSFTAKKIIILLQNDKRNWILKLLSENKPEHKTSSRFQFWEEGNHPKQMQYIEMFNQKTDYIHYNPVRRGLVEKEEDWIYSSARNYLDFEGKIVFKIDEL